MSIFPYFVTRTEVHQYDFSVIAKRTIIIIIIFIIPKVQLATGNSKCLPFFKMAAISDLGTYIYHIISLTGSIWMILALNHNYVFDYVEVNFTTL